MRTAWLSESLLGNKAQYAAALRRENEQAHGCKAVREGLETARRIDVSERPSTPYILLGSAEGGGCTPGHIQTKRVDISKGREQTKDQRSPPIL